MNSKLENLVDRETKLLLDEAENENLSDIQQPPMFEPTEQSIIKQKLMRPPNTAWSEELEKKMTERRKIALEKREERLRLAEERKKENQEKRREKFSTIKL